MEQTQTRRVFDAERHAQLIAAETDEDSQRRRLLNAERQAERKCTFSMSTWKALNSAAFEYDPLIAYVNHRLVIIERMEKNADIVKH